MLKMLIGENDDKVDRYSQDLNGCDNQLFLEAFLWA